MSMQTYFSEWQYRYYYSLLNEAEQGIYESLVEGMATFKPTVECVGCSVERAFEIYDYVRLDIPELFYVKPPAVCHNPLIKSRCTVLLKYRFDQETVKTILETMEKTVTTLKERIAGGLSELEVEKELHDYLASNVQYRDLEAPYSHEAPGALLYGIGVCEGIAKAFKYLADRFRLKAIVVFGNAVDSDGGAGGHAWNLCQINHEFYHVDVTFDSTLADGCLRYDYFNLSDKAIQVNHNWEKTLPLCSKDWSFYREHGQFMSSRGELAKYIRQQSKSCPIILFQIPAMKEDFQTILDLVKDTVRDNLSLKGLKTRRYTIAYNKNRMVFQINLQ